MKSPSQEKLGELLEDVVPSSAKSCGPDLSEVLEIASRESRRKRIVHSAAAGFAASLCLLGVAGWVTWQSDPGKAPIANVAEPKKPVVFERVDDSELLTLLEGAPAAIVEWPDGSRTLMVVENN